MANFDAFLNRLESSEIAFRSSLKGCSDSEIAALEEKFGISLPASYHWYLSMMGHRSGRLLTHDHYAAAYQHVLTLTDDYKEDWEPGPHVQLPADSLVIVGRLGEQFLMIRCNSIDDSPVWYFNEYGTDVREAYPTVFDWLCSLATDAELAIKSGYFKCK
ncbi:SMI1/KNR4 family protein [Stieleria sp. ICT_E10.1]|uniref:SMI1/KNR4 family protein n=1 Tax=Stieleria sedimenti TaxID=2976331 RepID=UPI00217F6AE8|nr:SMI1/KNR4 family protein [Stieleria sedimenti]MCS7466053.1 SMI1/KNR4 family protein [Stieleria sedimenti]